jgi:hypothetical protein
MSRFSDREANEPNEAAVHAALILYLFREVDPFLVLSSLKGQQPQLQ